MKMLGKIEAILNEKMLLLSSSEVLQIGEPVQVYVLIEDVKLKESGFNDPILIPKGKLRIVNAQKGNKYLAEIFRETKEITRKETVPVSAYTGLLARIQGQRIEITEEVPGEWSAEIDKSKSLNMAISKAITIGDLVGRL